MSATRCTPAILFSSTYERTLAAVSSSARSCMTSYWDFTLSIRFRMAEASLPRISASPAASDSFVQLTGFFVSFTALSISSGERMMVSALEEIARMLPPAS